MFVMQVMQVLMVMLAGNNGNGSKAVIGNAGSNSYSAEGSAVHAIMVHRPQSRWRSQVFYAIQQEVAIQQEAKPSVVWPIETEVLDVQCFRALTGSFITEK